MKHIVYKCFLIGSYEKEEKWLNEMSAKGMLLTDICICRYTFEEGTPGQYTYRLELLEHLPSHAESVAYIHFLESTGIEMVGSCQRWAYFRKRAADGLFQMYSDIDSKINHYKRITRIANVISSVWLFIAVLVIWEAIKQYLQYLDWFKRGFSCAPYHIQDFTMGAIYLAIAVFLQLIVIPVRKSVHKLKKEKSIRE